MTLLQRGQRLPLAQLTGSSLLALRVHLPMPVPTDLSLFGLEESRRLSDDRYFVFYNQPGSPEGAIKLNEQRGQIVVDLSRLPSSIHRLLLAATCDEGSFAALGAGWVSLSELEAAGERPVTLLELSGAQFGQERALMLLELYRHQGEWKLAAIGEGFAGGLQALLESLGGEVLEEPSAPPPEEAAPQKTSLDWGRLYSSGSVQTPEALGRFRLRFLSACSDAVLEYPEWQDLQRVINQEGLDARHALKFVRPDAVLLLERSLVLMRADGEVSEADVAAFEALITLLEVPESLLGPLRAELAEVEQATQIRKGHLPTVATTLILDSGEVAHLEIPASYRQITAKSQRELRGTLVLTNRQLHFVSPEGGWTAQYSKVLRIQEILVGVHIDLSVKRGSGLYQTEKPLLLAATLDALVRIHKRLLLQPQTSRASRHIPQKVKLSVWQRDQGKCAECGATEYLEFDHIIPHSLGGASTEANLQLLCRKCNLAKSDRL